MNRFLDSRVGSAFAIGVAVTITILGLIIVAYSLGPA